MRLAARWRAWAAHHRVHVGIIFALAYVAFSRPDMTTFWYGAAIVALGEGIRVWACGHLVRNEELTRDGLAGLADAVVELAGLEGLDAHAAAVTRRLRSSS